LALRLRTTVVQSPPVDSAISEGSYVAEEMRRNGGNQRTVVDDKKTWMGTLDVG
jgi:hypothetical protein